MGPRPTENLNHLYDISQNQLSVNFTHYLMTPHPTENFEPFTKYESKSTLCVNNTSLNDTLAIKLRLFPNYGYADPRPPPQKWLMMGVKFHITSYRVWVPQAPKWRPKN